MKRLFLATLAVLFCAAPIMACNTVQVVAVQPAIIAPIAVPVVQSQIVQPVIAIQTFAVVAPAIAVHAQIVPPIVFQKQVVRQRVVVRKRIVIR